MSKKTKAAAIMALAGEGKTTREIAIAVYGPRCNVRTKAAYVRVVLRQRKGRGESDVDRRHVAKKRLADPEWARMRLEQWAAYGELWSKTARGIQYRRNYWKTYVRPRDQTRQARST